MTDRSQEPEGSPILVVDDDPVHRRIVSARLEAHGHRVFAAETGEEAVGALLGDQGPRLAIIDVMMPDVDGLEVCRRVREAGLDAYRYLVLVTARDAQDDVVRGLDAGADDYLIKPVGTAELGARVRAGLRILRLEEELRAAREALRKESIVDPLTGLLNRRGLEPLLRQQCESVRRGKVHLSAVLVDVDHFKRVNDTHGHGAGDAVLAETGRRLRSGLRREDALCRWGGEEFLALLPRADAQGALIVSERMRGLLSAQRYALPDGPAISLTASFGVATVVPEHPVTAERLVEVADQALYTAKDTGRHRSVSAIAVP